MPNRIIREGIIDSPRVERLLREGGWPAEVFYRRLQQVVDDFGRFDGRPMVLKARCFPTVLDLVRDSDIERWIAACVKSGLVRVYVCKGQDYLEVLDFRQQSRAKTSKYPSPPKECAADAQQMLFNCEAGDTHLRSETETETETFVGDVVCGELPLPPILVFPCVKGTTDQTEWPLSQAKLDEYSESFPGLNALSECRKALQWCRDNPTKRKTFGGMSKFLGSWLSRAQNEHPRIGGISSVPNDPRGNFAAGDRFLRMVGEG